MTGSSNSPNTSLKTSAISPTVAYTLTASTRYGIRFSVPAAFSRKVLSFSFTDGDGDKWEELERDKSELEKSKPEKIDIQATPREEIPPEFTEWKKDNPWYDEDEELRKFADSISRDIFNANVGKDADVLFDLVGDRVKAIYPDKFKNPNREQPSNVAGGDLKDSSSNSGKKTYNDLPKYGKECSGV